MENGLKQGRINKAGLIAVKDIWNLQQPLTGCVSEYQPLEFVMVNGRAEEYLWDEMVSRWHYLGYKTMIGQRVKYLVYWQDMPISAISFNRASLRIEVRDRWLGWDEGIRRKLLFHVVNNNRFLILPWIRIKNLASHILSQSLRLLVRDWFHLYGVYPYAVETFVDMAQYQGTCYKAANWRYLGETRGFSKVGKAFVYHGKRKGVFFYLLNRKLLTDIARSTRRPFPKPESVRLRDMMLSKLDWSPNLFAEVGLNEESVAALVRLLSEYLDYYGPCFSRSAQQRNAETYVKGLLSDLDRKSVEPIALRYMDEKGVRTMQQFQRDAPWDDAQMKRLYQARVLDAFVDPEGMLTIDGSDFVKKGHHSAGVARQYCGRMGKVENCQAGVFIGYAGKEGYGLLDSRLYLPKVWFDEAHQSRREECDIPEQTTFRTKPQLAFDMIAEIQNHHALPFRWVGCDSAFGCDASFRAALPETTYFFADVHSNQHVFFTRPEWTTPERKSKCGREPTKPVPNIAPKPVSVVTADSSIPWEELIITECSKGPVHAQVKCCRIIESQDGSDGDELWLYVRKYENGEIKYALSNAPADIDVRILHRAATLRWPIEQCFQECKGYLGMSDYETRSYVAWHRHMLLVMIAFLFVFEVRRLFLKKNDINEPTFVLTMPQALRLIVAAFSQDMEIIKKTLRTVEYHMKNYAKSYRSYSRRRSRLKIA
jgi:SRSO17 transposase